MVKRMTRKSWRELPRDRIKRAPDRPVTLRKFTRQGTPMIRVQSEDFDIGTEIARLKQESGGGIGALAIFIGVVRDHASGKHVTAMTLEHYPGMTERELERIEAEAHRRWPLAGSLIAHRVGRLAAGDNIVLVIAASAHRQAAFEAAAFLMDYLKTSAPFWKKEEIGDGGSASQWVDARESDGRAARRWAAE
jgi:molybdopterin synthase catalytic subunit